MSPEREKEEKEEEGIETRDICIGIELEMEENEELPNTTKYVQEWLAMQGRKGREVVRMKSFVHERRMTAEKNQKTIETVRVGNYF